jgi:hypothetical protein
MLFLADVKVTFHDNITYLSFGRHQRSENNKKGQTSRDVATTIANHGYSGMPS